MLNEILDLNFSAMARSRYYYYPHHWKVADRWKLIPCIFFFQYEL